MQSNWKLASQAMLDSLGEPVVATLWTGHSLEREYNRMDV